MSGQNFRSFAAGWAGVALLVAGTLAGCGSGDRAPSRADRPATATPSAQASIATPAPAATTGPSAPAGSPATPSSGRLRSPAPSAPAIPPRPGTPGPPKDPTDTISTQWIIGTVAASSTGSCYSLVTDDGEWFAIYKPGGGSLKRGERVRAHVGPLKVFIHCGTGRQVSADKLLKI